MTNLQVFSNENFGEIRTLEQNGVTLFCGKDVATALGYKDTINALKSHCRLDGVVNCHLTDNLGRRQQAKFIDEGNVYRLITHSKLPSAEKFERWVFDEVLPSIRKKGSYELPTDHVKETLAEAKLRNAKVREASMWLKLSSNVDIPTYWQVCASYASKVLAGHEVIPLPESGEHYLSATEVGRMFGISSAKVGKVANANGLKVDGVYGKWFHDKSQHSTKEVDTFRYNSKGVEKFKEIL